MKQHKKGFAKSPGMIFSSLRAGLKMLNDGLGSFRYDAAAETGKIR